MPRRSPPFVFFFLFGLTVVAAVLMWPADPGAGDSPPRRADRVLPGGEHPVLAEIEAEFESQRARQATLRSALDEEDDFRSRVALEREIQRVKIDTETALLEIQLRHAEKTGNTATAEQLRESLAAYRRLGRRDRPVEPVQPPAKAQEKEVDR